MCLINIAVEFLYRFRDSRDKRNCWYIQIWQNPCLSNHIILTIFTLLLRIGHEFESIWNLASGFFGDCVLAGRVDAHNQNALKNHSSTNSSTRIPIHYLLLVLLFFQWTFCIYYLMCLGCFPLLYVLFLAFSVLVVPHKMNTQIIVGVSFESDRSKTFIQSHNHKRYTIKYWYALFLNYLLG